MPLQRDENPWGKKKKAGRQLRGILDAKIIQQKFRSLSTQTLHLVQLSFVFSLFFFFHGFRKSKYFEVQIMFLLSQGCGFTVECEEATQGQLPPSARKGGEGAKSVFFS